MINRLLLLSAVVLPAACDGAAARPRFIATSQWLPALECPSLPMLDGMSSVTDVTTTSDSTFAVLLGDERTLLMVGSDYQRLDSLRFDKAGPRGVMHPASVAVTDSMIFLADDARSVIRFFSRTGDDAGTLRLPFIPRRLRMMGTALVVTPLVAGGSPAHLAFEVRGRTARPLGGTIARYDDIGLNTLANMTAVAAFEDRVLVLHEMVVPFGYVMRPGQPANVARPFPVPVPAEQRSRLGRVPKDPISDRNVNDLTVVAFAAAPVAATGSVYYVTRADGGRTRRHQKLLVRLDSLLNVAEVRPINVDPHHMAYLPERGALVVVNADSEWFECKGS